jgi:hypothetical protein
VADLLVLQTAASVLEFVAFVAVVAERKILTLLFQLYRLCTPTDMKGL